MTITIPLWLACMVAVSIAVPAVCDTYVALLLRQERLEKKQFPR